MNRKLRITMRTSLSFRKNQVLKLSSMKQSRKGSKSISMYSRKSLSLPRTLSVHQSYQSMPIKNSTLTMLNSISMNLLQVQKMDLVLKVYRKILNYRLLKLKKREEEGQYRLLVIRHRTIAYQLLIERNRQEFNGNKSHFKIHNRYHHLKICIQLKE